MTGYCTCGQPGCSDGSDLATCAAPAERPIAEEFAVVVAALLAGRIDGQQAIASLAAIHTAALAEVADDGLAERVRALADRMEPALMGQPKDCTGTCGHDACDCSGDRPVLAWSGVTPDDLRALLSPAPSADRDERGGA